MRSFNVIGKCIPKESYMVDISDKLDRIVELVDNRRYLTINRARQCGKTTTLNELKKRLADEYICASISFQGVDDESFRTSAAFCSMFLRRVSRAIMLSSSDKEYAQEWQNGDVLNFNDLDEHITEMCRDKKVVLMIDEVDQTSSNEIFLRFLGCCGKSSLPVSPKTTTPFIV